MKIGNFDTNEKVFIIAEIGNNHEGDFDLAQKMIREAAKAGADAVKFQTIIPERLVTSQDTKRIAQLGKFQFSYDQFVALATCAKEEGVLFLSTPFDVETVNFLNDLVPAFKIASCDNTYLPLLVAVAKTGKPIIMSVGLADEKEIQQSLDTLKALLNRDSMSEKISLLHCVSNYPTEPGQAQLNTIPYLRRQFKCGIGYSDHTVGYEACLIAVALGAKIIEKHFTIDHHYSDFRDHQLSADPGEFKELVEHIRKAEILLGEMEEKKSLPDVDNREALRRSLAVNRNMRKGDVITEDDITWLRPGTGVLYGQQDRVLWKKLAVGKKQGELVFKGDVE